MEQNPSTCNLNVCNIPLFLNVLNLLCYVMLILVYIKIEYDVIIQNVENVICDTGVQCIPTHVLCNGAQIK